jgi:hypothetical protein
MEKKINTIDINRNVKVVVLDQAKLEPRPDLVGKWIDETHYHTLVQSDMDLYLPPDCAVGMESNDCDKDCSNCDSGLDERQIVFKFRKNYFSPELVQSAYEGLRDAATETQNRGTAAGPREGTLGNREWVTAYQWEILDAFKDTDASLVKEDKVQKVIDKWATLDKKQVTTAKAKVWATLATREVNFNFDEWVEKTRKLDPYEAAEQAKWVETKLVTNTTYANSVFSGIAGWYDRYPRIPWGRATAYTENYPEKFAKSFPYLKHLSDAFEQMLPWRYNNQMEAAKKIDPKFLVPDTPFSTITVNKNFRTAAHYDPANMENGFANICVFSNNGNYSGAYLVFPEIGYAVDVRPGDLLFVNNQAGLHGNTELVLHDDTVERISIIAFFHEGMLSLGSWEYEQARKEYVKTCMTDESHPYWRPRWNGVFEGMWADKEEKNSDYANAKGWYEFMLTKPDGKDWIAKHHPWLDVVFGEENNLSTFFG